MQQNASVVAVVGRTFDELVLQSSDNVLLEVCEWNPSSEPKLLSKKLIKMDVTLSMIIETGAHTMVS